MVFSTTVKCSKRVSWASPLIESPILHSPVHRMSLTVKACETHKTSQTPRTAIESLRDILRKQPPWPQRPKSGRRHDSLDVSNAVVPSTLTEQERENPAREEQTRARYEAREEVEKARYAQRQDECEQMLLCRDAFYEDRSRDFCWTAVCKFIDTLASRDTEPTSDYFFSKSDLLVALFVNCDLRFYDEGILADNLLRNLIHDCPNVKNFRFAVFFPRQLVEEKSEVPRALRYLLGTLGHMHRTASLEGATTEMEQKFVTRQLHRMRRARYDHVEIHEDSLDEGILIEKVDPDDTYEIVMGSRSSEESPETTVTQPINIIRRKQQDVEKAWRKPSKSFLWI
jgi:hypothetical protein